MEIIECNINQAKKNKIIKLINNSFESEERNKAKYVLSRLKKIYPNEIWGVLYLRKGKFGSYSYTSLGSKLYIDYGDFKIRIFSNPRIDDKGKDYSSSDDEPEDSEDNELSKSYSDSSEDNNIQNLKEEIAFLEKKIKDLKMNKKKIPSEKNLYQRDEMLALNFISSDQKIHFAVPCLKKDLFIDVEKKLYDKFPEYRGTNNTFIFGGKTIIKFKTIKENGLESGIPIILIQNNNN